MENYLCKECMQNEYELRRDADAEFPVFTIIGGILGTALSFVAGTFVLIPLTMIAGAGADLVCEKCGSNRDVHKVMDSQDDEYGKVYSVLDSKQGGEDSFWDMQLEPLSQTKYRYDQSEKKLVPLPRTDGSLDITNSIDGFDWSITTESTGIHGPETADSGSQNCSGSGFGTGNGPSSSSHGMGSMGD